MSSRKGNLTRKSHSTWGLLSLPALSCESASGIMSGSRKDIHSSSEDNLTYCYTEIRNDTKATARKENVLILLVIN